MKTKRPDKGEIFNAAAELQDPAERAAFLADACGDDSHLRAEIEELLDHDKEVGSFLAAPAVNPAPTLDGSIAEMPGTIIGRYKLLQQIGEGGFGVVFMAEQQEPVRRKVALKIIKPGMDSRAVVARFEAERQALALMDHPNIAHVYDGGVTDGGRPYFVMELVKGVPITNFCDKNNSPTEERLRLFVDVCRAVQHAHQKGVIHRDLKPSNIMITLHDGVPVAKVIDFGVAKALSQRLTEKTLFTAYGQMVGTPLYMSPEQAEMSGLDVDTRSDIYSLGVLLYELLTGYTPLEAATLREAGYVEVQRIIRETEPPRPSVRLSTSGQRLTEIAQHRSIDPKGLRRLVAGELDWIVMKALDKDRRRRYETATAFATDVERFLRKEPVEAGPPTAGYCLRKFVARRKALFFTAATIAAVLVFGTIATTAGLVWISRLNSDLIHTQKRLVEEAKRSEAAAVAEKSSRQRAQNEAVRRRRLQYISDVGLAGQACESGNLERLETLLRRHVPSGNEEDLRGFEWFYLWRQWKRESVPPYFQFPDPRMYLNWLALSFDGSRLAVGDPRGQSPISVVDMNAQKLICSFGTGPLRWAGVGLAISNDGKTVAYRGPARGRSAPARDRVGGCVIVRDVDTGQERSIETTSDFGTVALSPDLRTLAIGTEFAIWLWDLKTWEKTATLEGHEGRINALAFSPDGTRLASVSGDRTVRNWSLATHKVMWTGEGHSGEVLSVAYSPRCGFLATGSRDMTVAIWDSMTGRRLQTLAGARDEVRAVAFSRDATLFAALSRAGTVQVWKVPEFVEHEVLGGSAGVYGLAFLPDGRLMFDGRNGCLAVRKVRKSNCSVVHTSVPRGTVRLAAFSTDGTILHAIDDEQPRKVYRWKVTQEEVNEVAPLVLEYDAAMLAVSSQNVIAVSDSASATVYLYDFAGRQPKDQLAIARAVSPTSIAFSPSGRFLALGCEDGSVILWDVQTRQVLIDWQTHDGGVRRLCFCGDDATLLTGSQDRSAALWSVEQGKLLHSFGQQPDWVSAVGATHDGNILATGCWSSAPEITLWRRASYERYGALRGHTDSVYGMAILRDGRTIVSASADRTVRTWDSVTCEERCVIDAGTSIFECLAVSPDERTLAVGARGGAIRFYRAANPKEVQAEPDWWRLPGAE